MPVYLRKVASASALWASCSPWIFSAISVASTVPSVFGDRSARRPSAERGLIGLNCFGKPHHQGIGRQFVADRSLGDRRQGVDQRRQVFEVQIMADIDDEAELGGARGGCGAGLQQCRMVAAAEGGGVGTGVDLDAVGPGVVHRRDRGGVGIDEQDDTAAERLKLRERGVEEAMLRGI